MLVFYYLFLSLFFFFFSHNRIIQIIAPSLKEPFEIQQRRHESDCQRLIFAKAREKEALTHEQVKSKLPKKIKKLSLKSIKIEEKRLSSIKKKKMKVAFACVDKKRKADALVEETKKFLEKKKEHLVVMAENAQQQLHLNQELVNNLYEYEDELPKSGVGVITFVALYCDPIHSEDAIAIRESLLRRGFGGDGDGGDGGGGGGGGSGSGSGGSGDRSARGGRGETRIESSIVRRLLQLYLPHRTKRGTRIRKAGKRTGPMLSLDYGPLPETRYPPRSSYATQYLGMWVHIHLEIDKSAVDPARVIDAWHEVYKKHVMGHAAWTIQCLVRSTLARVELKKRSMSKKEKEENNASIVIELMMRRRFAKKKFTERKREIIQAKVDAKKQAQKDKALKMRALQQEKKRAAAAAAKKKQEAKFAVQEAERKRRGY